MPFSIRLPAVQRVSLQPETRDIVLPQATELGYSAGSPREWTQRRNRLERIEFHGKG